MLRRIALIGAVGLLTSLCAPIAAFGSSATPDIVGYVCDLDGPYCWNDAGQGYLQIVYDSQSRYISINRHSWAGHTTYEWELQGTTQCLTWVPKGGYFDLQRCASGRDYQAFWYDDAPLGGSVLVSEGASKPNQNWVLCAKTALVSGAEAVAADLGTLGIPAPNRCQWQMLGKPGL